MSLSVIVIVKNEESTIRECLASVAWADEIIVLDSGSTDQTVAICKEYTEHVYETDWPGFGPQKNRALEYASNEWVLSIDADERISYDLQTEIKRVIQMPKRYDAYSMPRRSNYCGRYMKHSGWWPDHVVRLFRRGKAEFSDDLVHERIVVQGRVGKLKEPIIHESLLTLEQILNTMNSYSTAGAKMMAEEQQEASLCKAICHGTWTFIRTYFLRAGFLDGKEGFMLAISNAEGTYYRYLKLMVLNREKQEEL
ncbi:SPBc2 prophage-derived glycosyltransferase SunS [Gimesia chilikensis]|uniref:SPBc2 prophage-derived glycosyltransferase SunS n=1 Tax=Gimesia chilikensis TaxID=2605989 RepID=A0A517W6V9_9PLAN|nr:glycosyltransferase family 2 protein [Gimesia chilikensis]QDU00981.1 SPBc2 prophage-derived glycosyltransferase SunS [Gimesia chilikensis]